MATSEFVPPAPRAQQQPVGERGRDSYLRRRGRDFLFAFYGAMRSIKLYPPDNPVVQKTLAELMDTATELLAQEGELELRFSGEFIFVNATRLRLELESYVSFSRILSVFREAGVGTCQLRENAAVRDWVVLLSQLQAPQTGSPDERRARVLDKLAAANVAAFELGPISEVDDEAREQAKEAAKRTYAQSVTVTKDAINSIRMGKSPSIKRIKRVVQGIVDQILNEETSLIGLTTLRDYDEYTFTHSVNVCIFSVALGRKIGLTRLQLYELGVAALMHDIGKARLPIEILNKPGGLNEDEWVAIQKHPWMGVLALCQMRVQNDIPYRAMVVAFEHHKKINLTGYPKHVRPRTMSIFSKMVAVADAFDAATSRRAYQSIPLSPADVLQEMQRNPNRGMDQVIVKAFMSMVGHYPVGTLVVLDTFELAVVHSVNPNPEAVSRPIVRVIADDRGNMLYPGTLVDLSAGKDGGGFARTIIKVADPERYGIRVGDYFL